MRMILAAVVLLAASSWQPAKVPPVDEAAQDPSFLAFRDTLMEAVRSRDGEHVLSILDERAHLSYGGDIGIDRFVEFWSPHDPSSPLWPELQFILGHGGVFVEKRQERQFCAPYVSFTWPPGFDAYDGFGAIVGADVPLHDSPSDKASVLRRLSYDLVRAPYRFHSSRTTPPDVPEGWIIIKTADGTKGYVRSSRFRSPIDRRACFRRSESGWLMDSFIAGD